MKKALYRTFRPQTFDEVKDQDPITTVLKNQVRTGNIGHAYIFSGGRGTGKTSCAKIFARAVNCLHPVNGNPCNECENCRAILDETTMDVVEMDAASNRRIDDIRELRDQVIYPPSQLKYKVYIIDEAHMITNEAFNALLKIMEEPPAHLIFILATTEIDKVPQTILSRTQRYEFMRIGLPAIEEELRMIAGKLNLDIEEAAIHAIALSADGAMRDALSLLDQVIASDQHPITEKTVNAILGSISQNSISDLTDFLLTDDLCSALTYTEKLYGMGKDPHNLIQELILYFRNLLLIKGGVESQRLHGNEEELQLMQKQVRQSSLQRLADSLEILIRAELNMRKADYADALFQTTLVRLVNYVDQQDILSRLQAVESKLETVQRWQNPETVAKKALMDLLAERAVSLPQPGHVDPSTGSKEEQAAPDSAPVSSASEDKTLKDEDPAPFAAAAPSASGNEAPVPPAAAASTPESDALTSPVFTANVAENELSDSLVAEQSASENEASASLTPVMKAFEEDPLSWLQAHRGEINRAVAQLKKINPFFLGKYQQADLLGNKLYLTYGKKSPSLRMMEQNRKSLQDILNELTGGDYLLVLGDERPDRTERENSSQKRRTNLSQSAGPAMTREKMGDQSGDSISINSDKESQENQDSGCEVQKFTGQKNKGSGCEVQKSAGQKSKGSGCEVQKSAGEESKGSECAAREPGDPEDKNLKDAEGASEDPILIKLKELVPEDKLDIASFASDESDQ